MPEPVRYLHERTLPTHELAEAWRVFSDTDQFNRHAGLNFRFDTERTPDGRRVRIGRVRRFGLELDWVDDPFEIEAPRRFLSRRRFRRGPLRSLVTRMNLAPGPDGVRLRYEVELEPVGWWAAPLVQIELATSIRPMLERTLADAAAALAGGRFSPTDPPKDAAVLASALGDLASGPALQAAIGEADRRAQDTLRPLALARQAGLPPDVVIVDMLEAARRGALEMSFDLLCPSCRGATTRLASLRLASPGFGDGRRHCESCEIALDGTFPDEVEVTFRPARRHRPEPPPLDCVHSPSHTPHLRSRWALAAGEERPVDVDWEPGSWRIRTDPDLGQDAAVEVRAGLVPRGAAIDAGPQGLSPSRLALAPGAGQLVLRNLTDHPVWVELHRRSRPADLLTVGRLLDLPAARALLPPDVVEPKFRPAKAGGILVIDAFGREADLDEAVRAVWRGADTETYDLERAEGPTAAHRADGAYLAIFERPADAWAAARRMLPAPRLSLVVAAGDVTFLPNGEATWPAGGAVDRAVRAARALGPGRFGLPLEQAGEEPFRDLVAKAGVQTVPHPELGAALVPVPWGPAARAAWPERVGGRFVLGDELARGGMGIVRAAFDPHTGSRVVLKTLTPEGMADPLQVQRFLWEARLTSRVNHPHCVRILAYGCDGDLPWMALERLEGEDLGDRLKGTPKLPVRQAVGITLDVLEGLQAAHEGGVVHRDVKPGNIWLSATPRPDHARVLDFGIALALDDADAPEDGRLIGSPRYMAPEQVAREPVDGRADVYACATVLFEMLTGRTPFAGPDARTLALRRLTEPAPSARSLDAAIPEPLSQILDRALARDPAARWPDPRSLGHALRAWITADEGADPEPPR